MVLPLKVHDAEGADFGGPYLLYVPGWTEERYVAEAPESWFVEFVDGELVVHSPVSIKHQDITGFLTFLLKGYVDSKRLGRVFNGPAVVRLRPGLLYEPDIFFVGIDKTGRFEEQQFSGAPDLVVEVISESTRRYDLRTKASNYRQSGVPEYWVIDTARQLLFLHLIPGTAEEDYRATEVGSGVLKSCSVPQFWIDVSWLWQEPLPGAFDCLRRILGA